MQTVRNGALHNPIPSINAESASGGMFAQPKVLRSPKRRLGKRLLLN
jgi:hypothetical protein